MKKDYYDILGVKKTASDAEIKNAYRKMAREHHPDMAKGDKSKAEEKFKELNEAYQILGDATKRKTYDQYGHSAFNGSAGAGGAGAGFGGFGGNQGNWGPFSYQYNSGGAGFDGVDPFDIFEEFFGGGMGGRSRRPQRGRSLHYEMHIDFADAVKGTEKKVQIETGDITIKVPKGARDGVELKFAGKGLPGSSGVNGDLFITLRVSPPKHFQWHGADLYSKIELDFLTAILGGEVEINVINDKELSGLGKATLKIPAGTQPGTTFKVKGKGMPKLAASGYNDVLVQAFIAIPKTLTKNQKQALEKIKEEF